MTRRLALGLAIGLALGTLTAAGPALAQTPMTADEFEAWSTGQTLDYWYGDTFFGSEMHLPGRQTMDSDPGGPCVMGLWQPAGDAICFVYDGSDTPHCWRFWRDGGKVFAQSLSDDPGDLPATVTLAPAPLACTGPEVGA